MYLTPKFPRLFSASILGLALLGGCSSERVSQGWSPGFERHVNAIVRPSQARFDPVLPDSAPDEAASVRTWETDKYLYPNGGVVAHPTYAPNYEDRPAWLQNDCLYAALSPVMLMADVGALPFWLVVEPPTTNVEYRGVRYPPSMTVAPPLPKE